MAWEKYGMPMVNLLTHAVFPSGGVELTHLAHAVIA
jgi:hypothetical protein